MTALLWVTRVMTKPYVACLVAVSKKGRVMETDYPQSANDIAQRIMTRKIIKLLKENKTNLPQVIGNYLSVYPTDHKNVAEITRKCLSIYRDKTK